MSTITIDSFCKFMRAVHFGFFQSARKTLQNEDLFIDLEAVYVQRGREVVEVFLREQGLSLDTSLMNVDPGCLLGEESSQLFDNLREWLVSQHPVLEQIETEVFPPIR